MKIHRTAIVLALMMVLALPMVLADPAGGQVTQGTASSGNESTSGTVTIDGGEVNEVNVTGIQNTGRWAGFFGTITGGLKLGDSAGSIFYEWTVSNVDGAVVYAAPGPITAWGGAIVAAAADGTNQPAYLLTTSADNFTNTFAANDTFTSASLSIVTTPYAETWQNGVQGSLRTFALRSTTDSLNIYAALADDGAVSFQNDVVDYQLLVPADSLGETYNFYLELP